MRNRRPATPELDGALYRLAGAWYYPPKYDDDVLLHADGMISHFRVGGGPVSYAARYVETGPPARALLPFPAAPQVHGCWVQAAALPLP